MSAKHTPGPWANDGIPIDSFRMVVDCSGTEIAEIQPVNAEANARLIAASPDMLAALRKIEARLTAAANAFYVSGKRSDLQAALDGWKSDAHEARAAIAKAEAAP